jgi:hypothetical protein
VLFCDLNGTIPGSIVGYHDLAGIPAASKAAKALSIQAPKGAPHSGKGSLGNFGVVPNDLLRHYPVGEIPQMVMTPSISNEDPTPVPTPKRWHVK